jgi:hypothetical protein
MNTRKLVLALSTRLAFAPQRQRPRPEFQSQLLRRPQANFATLDGVQRLQQPENLVYPEPVQTPRFGGKLARKPQMKWEEFDESYSL